MIENLGPADNPYADCGEAVRCCEQDGSPIEEMFQRARNERCGAETFIRTIKTYTRIAQEIVADDEGALAILEQILEQMDRPSFTRYVRARLGQV